MAFNWCLPCYFSIFLWCFIWEGWCRNCQPGRLRPARCRGFGHHLPICWYSNCSYGTWLSCGFCFRWRCLDQSFRKNGRNARGRKTGQPVILDGGDFEGLKWRKKLNVFVDRWSMCFKGGYLRGHEHWHSLKWYMKYHLPLVWSQVDYNEFIGYKVSLPFFGFWSHPKTSKFSTSMDHLKIPQAWVWDEHIEKVAEVRYLWELKGGNLWKTADIMMSRW